ncbi:hypothetical protein EYF80_044236 [Liparis tanakae]|uniref:Uncharacterized protein n=1 Tax=Liparis tanakae TaxID=230148 RepID=A0A4Z2FWG8_9TELE|nr:hypothetical protein EYF80_044236 [Liparis tanakae]
MHIIHRAQSPELPAREKERAGEETEGKGCFTLNSRVLVDTRRTRVTSPAAAWRLTGEPTVVRQADSRCHRQTEQICCPFCGSSSPAPAVPPLTTTDSPGRARHQPCDS